MEGGTNVDYWEFQALMAAVDEFQMHYQPVGVIASPTVADNQAEQNGEEKNEGEQVEEEKAVQDMIDEDNLYCQKRTIYTRCLYLCCMP